MCIDIYKGIFLKTGLKKKNPINGRREASVNIAEIIVCFGKTGIRGMGGGEGRELC